MNRLVLLMLLLSSIMALEAIGNITDESSLLDTNTNLETVKYQCSYLERNRIFSYKIAQEKIENDNLINTTIFGQDDLLLYFSFCDD